MKCKETFNSESKASRHSAKCNLEFKCNLLKQNHTRHVKLQHGIAKQLQECDVCNEKFKFKGHTQKKLVNIGKKRKATPLSK